MARPKGLSQSLPALIQFGRYISPYVKQRKWLIVGAFAGLFGQTLVRLLEPWPIKFIIDKLVTPEQIETGLLESLNQVDSSTFFMFMALALVSITIARALLTYATTICMALAGNHVIISLREKLFRHLQELSSIYHQKQRSGDLVVRIISDIGLIKDIAITAAVPLIGNAFIFVGIIGVMLWLNWQLALIALSTLPLLWFITLKKSKRIHKVAKKNRQREGVMAATASESINAIKSVQALTLEDRFSNIFSDANKKSLKEGVQGKRLAASLQRSVEILTAVSTALVLWFGALKVVEGVLTPGELIVFVYYLRRVFRPVRDFSKYTARLAKASAAGERVLKVLDQEVDIKEDRNAKEAGKLNGDIQFSSVHFSYLEDKHANLTDINFKVGAGQKVAIVGPSGSGKSTLISLLMRLHDPQSGSVRVDDVDIRDYRLSSYRRQIAVVMQDTALFATSIADNITIGQSDVTEERMMQAAKLADMHDFIQGLPNGYDTEVGERGVTLSAGQRQRIAIARATLRDAPILILDEPTTGLDPATEQSINLALMKLAQSRTTLIVTHRKDLTLQCDSVIFIRNGRIAEQGQVSELGKEDSEFSKHFASFHSQLNAG